MIDTGYILDQQGAMAFSRAWYGPGQGDIILDNVRCVGSEATLLECKHNELFRHNCVHREDAGVKCIGDEEIRKNISVRMSTSRVSVHTALITWMPQNTTQYQPSSYKIECFSSQHQIKMVVNNATFSLELVGLLTSTTYNCCVSAMYGSYTARRVCTETATIQPPTSQPSETPMQPSENSTVNKGDISAIKPSETPMMQPSESPTVQPGGILTSIKPTECPTTQLSTQCTCEPQGNNSRASNSSLANTIGGVLGFIVAVLIVLLAVLGAALVYLLRSRFLVPRK